MESEKPNTGEPDCAHDSKKYLSRKNRLRCCACKALVCPECSAGVNPRIRSHFRVSNARYTANNTCKTCHLPLRSQCSLKAHMRIHTADTPYVCPECGLIYKNMRFLVLHMLNKCFHLYKVIRYKCKNCPGSSFTYENYEEHIKEYHMVLIFKCSHCNAFFESAEEVYSHMKMSNQQMQVRFQKFYRCKMCTDTQVPKHMYRKHLDYHLDCTRFLYVNYECLCGELFTLSETFRSHIKNCNTKENFPPYWEFLREKIKNFELIRLENNLVQEKPEPINCLSAISFEPCLKKSDFCIKPESENNKVIQETLKNDSPKATEINNSKKEGKTQVKLKPEGQNLDDTHVKSNITNDDFENVHPVKKLSSQTESILTKLRQKNEIEIIPINKTDSPETSKNYDHIPCDHLGYLRAQSETDLVKKNCENQDTFFENGSDNSKEIEDNNVTESDEIIVPRKVPAIVTKDVISEKADQVESDDVVHIQKEITEKNTNGFISSKNNVSEEPKQESKQDIKYVNCPFCVTVFTKKKSIFEEFRDHIKHFHADAAVDITVQSDEEKIETNDDNLPDPHHSKENSINKIPEKKCKVSSKNYVATTTHQKSVLNKKKISKNTSKIQTNDKNKVESMMVTTNESIKKHLHKDQPADKEKSEVLKSSQDENDFFLSLKLALEKKGVTCEKKPSVSNLKSKDKEIHSTSQCSGEGNREDTNVETNLLNGTTESSIQKDKSRRESEVWSELYQSLELAEKNKKKRKMSKCDEDKKSCISNYSEKRKIKKPMRYRESSEWDEDQFKELDDNIETENAFSEEVGEFEKDRQNLLHNEKNQVILNKLQNINPHITDHVDNFNNKKEKIDLHKKHSLQSNGKYKEDLLSYRNKMLPGIIQKVEPMKYLGHQDLSKYKDSTAVNTRVQDGSTHAQVHITQVNLEERKRGRPRKLNDSNSVKNKSSDRELSFVEKNLEKLESLTSHSTPKQKQSTKLQDPEKSNESKEKNDLVPNQEESLVIKENQCKVCLDQFDSAVALSKHFRTHGLAFLKELKKKKEMK